MEVDADELLKAAKRSHQNPSPRSCGDGPQNGRRLPRRNSKSFAAFALQSPVFQVTFLHAQMMTKLVKVSGNHQLGEFIAILTALLPDSG